MTQIGETVAPGMIDTDEAKCPFDHSPGDPPDVENILIGDGQELGEKMSTKQGTHLYEVLKKDRIPNEVLLDPRERKNCFKNIEIKLKISKSPTGKLIPTLFPVTCAAHHCIPAQASLKNHKILQYMCKKGKSNKLKGTTYSSGKVWANVGYDVNGSQNGIWLPGNYAVAGGTGGIGAWTKNNDSDNEVGAPGLPSKLLTRSRHEVSFDNRKWLYVSKAVNKLPGQFHDAHPDYSKEVAKILTKIWENYNSLREEKVVNKKCEECKKRATKIKELGLPTPFGLVDRLNKVSDKFKNLLNGNSWNLKIYTSKWGLAYMKAVKAKHPASRAGSE